MVIFWSLDVGILDGRRNIPVQSKSVNNFNLFNGCVPNFSQQCATLLTFLISTGIGSKVFSYKPLLNAVAPNFNARLLCRPYLSSHFVGIIFEPKSLILSKNSIKNEWHYYHKSNSYFILSCLYVGWRVFLITFNGWDHVHVNCR